jgi:hypothetical protein
VEEEARQVPASKQRLEAITYAEHELKGHRRARRLHQWASYFFQSLTIVAAATATVMAVADPADIAPEYRAIPAAVATLGASVLAAFQFRVAWSRHVTAVRNLDYELLKFENDLREYRPTRPRPEPDGVDAFLGRVEAISRAGHEEQPHEKTVAETESGNPPQR